MAADALDVRMARLEGAYEQIDKRLDALHGDIQTLRTELTGRIDRVDHRIDRVEQKIDTTFRWVIGVILVNWVTLMLAILLHR